jgi:L-amino acid N-acyltransferase
MIRKARIEDIEDITGIYNQAIEAGFQTAFTETFSPEERVGWFYEHSKERYPLLVYEQGGRVAGYLAISAYRPGRKALESAAEISYFVDSNHRKKGIGAQLLAYGINDCKLLKYRTLLAIILEANAASANLLEKFGFEKWGYLPEIADFDGTLCSQVYYGLKL